jgi:hypothetical protein
MSACRLLPLLLALVGCSMDNPSFGGESGTGESGLDSDTATDPSTTAETTDPTIDPMCPLGPGTPLEIDLAVGSCSGDDPLAFSRPVKLVEAVGSTLRVHQCNLDSLDCSVCADDATDTISDLSFAPLVLDDIAPEGTCLHVAARRIDGSNPVSCRYDTVVVEAATNGTRVGLLLGRNTAEAELPPIDGNTFLDNFDPVAFEDQTCACDKYPDDCCDGVAPTTFEYEIGTGMPVAIGGHATLTLPVGNYEFTALDGFQPGECGKPKQIAWALVRKP